MISLAIIGMVAAVSIPNLRDFNKSQDIDNTTSQLVNVLKNAQSSAASHVMCPNNEPAVSWQVDIDPTGTTDTYSLISNCETLGPKAIIDDTPFAATPTSSNTFVASTNVCAASEITMIYFINQQIQYQCANGAILGLSSDLRVSLTKAGSNPVLARTIVIQQGGIIRIE